LVQLVEEGLIKNVGGMTLQIVQVPVERWAYEIKNRDDMWQSEFVVGKVHKKEEIEAGQ
jgi:hypothetical protein